MAWTFGAASLNSGWSGSASTASDGAVNATIRMKGAITGRPDTVAFTLSAGRRPATTLYVPAIDWYGAHSFGLRKVVLQIDTNGDVTPRVAVNANTGNEPVGVVLDGISFAGEA